MKALTYSAMAAARLRANKRQYLSLVLGIFLSIFLITSLALGVYGIYLAFLEKRCDKVGDLDMVALDGTGLTDEELAALGMFDRMGHAFLSGEVTGHNVYVGYYDETGIALMNLEPLEGRLPENPGEMAVERSAMDVLESKWQLGDVVELAITPINGVEERRSFTVVGFLPERSENLKRSDYSLGQFPAIVTSSGEPGFAVGRLAVHNLMDFRKGVSMDAVLKKVQDAFDWHAVIGTYALSITGQQEQFGGVGNALYRDREMYNMIAMAAALASALILSCGVGIAGAMEGMLSKRQEEIGVLRALGATRRQIRRMFGRENLILALVVSPLSMVMGCLAIWVLSRLLPGSVVFGLQPWLLLPIGVFGAAVVMLAGYLPLNRASKLMPMSVIRDTTMLRRSKGVKFRREFSPAKLIAARQIRFHPTRQLGAAVLVGLMVLCSGLFVALASSFDRFSTTENIAFYISGDGGISYSRQGVIYESDSMDQRSVNQLRSLDHVRKVWLDRVIPVTVMLDKVPQYAMTDVSMGDTFGMLDEEQFQEAMSWLSESHASYYESIIEDLRQEYRTFLETYQIPGEAMQVALITLDREECEALSEYLESGSIHLDAINAGQEVIVLAPEVWTKFYDTGSSSTWYSREAMERSENGKGAMRVAWNDCFSAGQTLPLMRLWGESEDGEVYREDAAVTVGAVVSQMSRVSAAGGAVMVITTEQGLQNMGLTVSGLRNLYIYLDGEVSLQEEEMLDRQITAIARRTEGYNVTNNVASHRDNARAQRQVALLLAAMATLFFAVAVGMIVSAVTRQLNSEGRTIGMLRAVGADERAILGCYSGQITASVAGGMGISFALLLLYTGSTVLTAARYGLYILSGEELRLLGLMVAAICAMGAGCYFACRFFLRLRIREIVNKSIIENIREL